MTNEPMTNEPINIGYDAKRAFLNATGLGNYSRWLIGGLSAYAPGHAYHLFTPKTRPNAYLHLLQSLPRVFIHLPKSRWFTSWWRSKSIVNDLKRNGIQLYHGLSHELPLGIAQSGIAPVVTVHDVIALRFPHYFGWFNRSVYVAKLKYACKTANRIVAISEQTKQDLVDLLQVDAGKIAVIYQNCDASFGVPASEDQKQLVSATYRLPAQYLLTVGTIEQRKNLMLLVKALSRLPGNIPLVVVGKPAAYLDKVKRYLQQHKLTERVIFLHRVPFAHLPALYQMAGIFIYPSRYEGFGIPVLEALNAGVPVIAAKGSCLEEAGGPDSLYVDPDDDHDLAQKILQVLADEQLRQHMISRGKQYAATFDDAKLAAQMITLYQQTLQHHA